MLQQGMLAWCQADRDRTGGRHAALREPIGQGEWMVAAMNYDTLIKEATLGMSIIRFVLWADEMDRAGATVAGQMPLPDGSGRHAHKFIVGPAQELYVRRCETGRYQLWSPTESQPAIQ